MLFNKKYLLACTKHPANINIIQHNSTHLPPILTFFYPGTSTYYIFPYLRVLFKGYIPFDKNSKYQWRMNMPWLRRVVNRVSVSRLINKYC